jgi:hypothetical protein
MVFRLALLLSLSFASAAHAEVDAALARCFAESQRLKALAGFPSDAGRRAARDAAVTEVQASFLKAPRRYGTSDLKLWSAPNSASTDDTLPMHEPVVIAADCGSGWLLAVAERHTVIQNEKATSFITGFVRAVDVQEAPPSCAQLSAWMREKPFGRDQSDGGDPRAVVVASVALVRAAPTADAMIVQKLGYGNSVERVSEACDGFSLVRSRYGYGFIKSELLGSALLDEAALTEKRTSATSAIEKLLWSQSRARLFPSDDNVRDATVLRESLKLNAKDKGRCETFVGACDVLLTDSLYQRNLDTDPHVGDVPVAPWWALTAATGPAQPVAFAAAYVSTSGECNCCGCESCQTKLEVAFWAPGDAASATVVGASRRPPTAWFHGADAGGCKDAEQRSRASPRWDVPLWDDDTTKPATLGSGQCVPAADGTVWWVQRWTHPEMDGESNEVLRSYRLKRGRVVETGTLHTAQASDRSATPGCARRRAD